MLKDRVCPHIQNTSCPSGFHCWDFNSECSESTIHFLFCTDKYPLKEHNLFSSFSPVPVHFIFYINTEFQVILLKKWESLIGTQALHIISIFIWRITPHRPDNLAPQISSLSVFWSHSGWSPGWADSAWKAALSNKQCWVRVKRQQVEREIDALQLRMDHFSRQLSAWIIIIIKVCLQKC